MEILEETDEYVIVNFRGTPIKVQKTDDKESLERNEILGQVERINYLIKKH